MPIKTQEKKVSTSPKVEGFVNAFYRSLKKMNMNIKRLYRINNTEPIFIFKKLSKRNSVSSANTTKLENKQFIERYQQC